MPQAKLVAIDFETHLITGDQPVPYPVCLSFSNGRQTGLLLGQDIEDFLLDNLLDKDVTLLCHNIAFEALVILKYFPKLRRLVFEALDEGQFFCTQIMWQLYQNIQRDYDEKSSLAHVVFKLFGLDISEGKTDPDAWRMRYQELENTPLEEWPEAAKDYAIMDSVWSYRIYIALQDKFKRENAQETDFMTSIRASVALNLMGKWGFKIDPERVTTLDEEVSAILEPRYEKLIGLGMASRKKDGSIKKNRKAIEEHIKNVIKEPKKTSKGNIATSNEILNLYLTQLPSDDILHDYLEIMEYEKSMNTYCKALKASKPYLYSEYNAVVRSGRTSCRKSSLFDNSANLQNQPRGVRGTTYDIRNCFTAREGYILVAIDYAGLELAACAAQLLKYYGASKMATIINSGDTPIDMHTNFLSFVKGISYQEGLKYKKTPEGKEARQMIKEPHLGKPGGIGIEKIRVKINKMGIPTQFQILQTYPFEDRAYRALWPLKKEVNNVRVQRTGRREWSIVYDELVEVFEKIYDMYPQLADFTKEGHNDFAMEGEIVMKYDEWTGKREPEQAYQYRVGGSFRRYCTYTSMCNGFLMQTGSANGFKETGWALMKEFYFRSDVNVLGGIHDEYLFEIKKDDKLQHNLKKCCEIMLKGMQVHCPGVRLAVEYSVMTHWSKNGPFLDEGMYFLNPNETEVKKC